MHRNAVEVAVCRDGQLLKSISAGPGRHTRHEDFARLNPFKQNRRKLRTQAHKSKLSTCAWYVFQMFTSCHGWINKLAGMARKDGCWARRNKAVGGLRDSCSDWLRSGPLASMSESPFPCHLPPTTPPRQSSSRKKVHATGDVVSITDALCVVRVARHKHQDSRASGEGSSRLSPPWATTQTWI